MSGAMASFAEHVALVLLAMGVILVVRLIRGPTSATGSSLSTRSCCSMGLIGVIDARPG